MYHLYIELKVPSQEGLKTGTGMMISGWLKFLEGLIAKYTGR
jgi:hypothetical protein